MIRIIITTFILLIAALTLDASAAYKNIVVVSLLSQEDADNNLKKIKYYLNEEAEIRTLKEENKFNCISRKSGKYFIVSIEPFYNDKVMSPVFKRIQKKFPDAFVYTHWGDNTIEKPKVVEKEVVYIEKIRTVEVPKIIEKEVVVVKEILVKSEENNILLWLGFLGLVVIGLILIFRSSRQTTTIVKTRSEMKKSQEKNEELLVNVSEKIQEPVNEIIEHSEKIFRGGINDQQAENLENLRYSDELLLDITNDLIDFLKLQSGKLEVQNALFNINNVLDEVAGMVSGKARGSEVEFIFDIDKSVPAKVIGDPLRLSQLLVNLLSNAMKFTDKGEVKLKVKRLENRSADVMLQFDVMDTGIGIEADRIQDIFAPFSFANDKSQTGMGLYISKKLAQLMGGDIQVESVINQGTTFVVTIALSMENLREQRHYRLPSKSYTGHNILILDNNHNAAEALQKMLQYFRHNVDVIKISDIYTNMSLLAEYEIIIAAEDLLLPSFMNYIKKIKVDKPIKLVAVGSMLVLNRSYKPEFNLIDRRIIKPFSQQRVMELVINLFDETKSIKEEIPEAVSEEYAAKKVLKTTDTSSVPKEIRTYDDVPITPGINRESFKVFSGANILIAEDNIINQKVLTGLLGSSGIHLLIANDGQEALDIIESGKEFDLVLMDINMPVMDGYEATRKIREKNDRYTLPVVSLTGLGLPEEIEKMYDFGMNAHLIKPLQVGALYTIFDRYLNSIEANLNNEVQEKKLFVFRNSDAISFKDGLDRASGDEELYVEILKEFVELYQNADIELRDMIMNNDLSPAQKLCLDIRGVAANIGAQPLSQTALQLQESFVKNEEKDLISLSKVFQIQIQELLETINGQV
ncbi:MAG: hypothetical protein DRG30_06705 [Epsilonproteobacteria bacterium]|nr:MAG: hypothetical protein DRG30_06705 [Campylobacterota bacterium]